MSTATVATQPDVTLGKLQTIVQQQEEILGPLKQIRTANGRNVLEFEVQARPESGVILRLSEKIPPVPAKGYVLVCHGDCFISGKQKYVAAFRAESA